MTYSSVTILIGNADEDYKAVSRFNKLNKCFTLQMRIHLKLHPFDYFMYHEDSKVYIMSIFEFHLCHKKITLQYAGTIRNNLKIMITNTCFIF